MCMWGIFYGCYVMLKLGGQYSTEVVWLYEKASLRICYVVCLNVKVLEY